MGALLRFIEALNEMSCRTAVLRQLGPWTEAGLVTLERGAACDIVAFNELLTTALLLNATALLLDATHSSNGNTCSGYSAE